MACCLVTKMNKPQADKNKAGASSFVITEEDEHQAVTPRVSAIQRLMMTDYRGRATLRTH